MATADQVSKVFEEALNYSDRITYEQHNIMRGQRLQIRRIQQSFLVAQASVQDLLQKFHAKVEVKSNTDIEKHLPDHFHMILSDPMVSFMALELLRVLVDDYGLEAEAAINLTRKCFSFRACQWVEDALQKMNTNWHPHFLLSGTFFSVKPEDLARTMPRHYQLLQFLHDDALEKALARKNV